MNHQPKTAMNDPALQLAVSSVLQLGALKTMFSCKAARTADCKWSFGFAVIKNESIMSEYRFHLQNTDRAVKQFAQSAAESPVLPDMLTGMRKLHSLTMWANVIISTAVATIIPRRSIFRIIQPSKKP